MGGGGEYSFGGQFLPNLGKGLALDNALEDAPDNGGGFLVQNPLLAVVRVVQIAVGECSGDVLSRRRPRAEYRPYLPAGISCVPLRKDVPSVEKKDAALYPLSCNRYRVLVIDNMFFLGRIGIS
jgi:hypothetical protein